MDHPHFAIPLRPPPIEICGIGAVTVTPDYRIWHADRLYVRLTTVPTVADKKASAKNAQNGPINETYAPSSHYFGGHLSPSSENIRSGPMLHSLQSRIHFDKKAAGVNSSCIGT